MQILWHSNAPYAGTGYGVQTALFAPRIKQLGHDVAISAFYGLHGSPTKWNGLTVLPGGNAPYGNDVVGGHALVHFAGKSGLVITLCDVWVLDPELFKTLPVASWVPIDCEPMSALDKAFFTQTKAKPIAMSRHGEKMLKQAGFEPFYVPHGVDTKLFTPDIDVAKAREVFGIPDDAFVVAINAANKGVPSRKAFAQQFLAFAKFRKKHSDAILAVHTNAACVEGEKLYALADACGIKNEDVRWSNQYLYNAGLLSQEYVAGFYRSANVVSNASKGEGFGLAALEAQACGTPVVVTNHTASKELCGAGWRVKGIPDWNDHHQAWWLTPDPDELTRAYEAAYKSSARMSETARGFALKYDVNRVLDEYWKPVLTKLTEKQ